MLSLYRCSTYILIYSSYWPTTVNTVSKALINSFCLKHKSTAIIAKVYSNHLQFDTILFAQAGVSTQTIVRSSTADVIAWCDVET